MGVDSTRYTIWLNIGSLSTPVVGSGWLRCYPNKEGVVIFKERDSEYNRVVRKGLKGNLRFLGAEFRALKTIKDAQGKYVPIKVKFNGLDRLEGRLIMTGEWDENKNLCELPYQIVDEYSYLLKNKTKEINIKTNDTHTVYKEQTYLTLVLTLPCFNGTQQDAEFAYKPKAPIGEVQPLPETRDAEWDYWTLVDTQECEGGYIYVYNVDYVEDPADGWIYSDLNGIYYRGIGTTNALTALVRWIKHFDIMQDLITNADSTILLDLSTYCTYFTVTDTELQYLYVANKSDIKRNSSSDPAAFEMLHLEDWVRYHKDMFQLDWYVDSGYFKFVRPATLALPSAGTYPAHDLTTFLGLNYTDHQKRYQIITDNKVSKESWEFEVSSWQLNSFLDYETFDKADKKYSLQSINNDLDYLLGDPDKASDSGLIFVATRYDDSKYKIINKVDPFGGVTPYINGKLKPLRMIYEHFAINRPYTTAYLDNVLNTVTLTKEEDQEVEFKNLPIDDINDISFDYLVKSEVGDFIPNVIEIDISERNHTKLKGIF
jgi:hypothetical protein